jgi:hypothetical protein
MLLQTVFSYARLLIHPHDWQTRRVRSALGSLGSIPDPQKGMFLGLLDELEEIWPAAWDDDPAAAAGDSSIELAA